jgi:hypothetical protein
MHLTIAAAMFLAVGVAQAAEPLTPFPGETRLSFECRSAFIPPARQCMARCQVVHAEAGRETERFACVQSCTTRGLDVIAECRSAGAGQETLSRRPVLVKR